MNENDLRVIKTRERIEAAMLELLQAKPLEKITVTELAKTAQINKGTFYLHYQDILDLYRQVFIKCMEQPYRDATFFSDFFDEPDAFVRKLGEASMAGLPTFHAVQQPGQQDFMFMKDVREIMTRKIYETGRIEKTIENDIKLDALFSAILGIMPKYGPEHQADAYRVIVSMIRSQFPQP